MMFLGAMLCLGGGCATIRVTDTARTADEDFLLSEAATRAVAKLSLDAVRGRSVWIVSEYAFATTQPYNQSFFTNEVREPQPENAFMIAELRARLLQAGARLAVSRTQADVILEVRSGGLAINRIDFLLGIPALALGGSTVSSVSSLAVATPNLALFQSIKQDSYGSIAVVAYWRTTGEILATSGPFVGHAHRYDYLIFGYALAPLGDIPPTLAGAAK